MPKGIYKHKKGFKRAPFSEETRHKMSVIAKNGNRIIKIAELLENENI